MILIAIIQLQIFLLQCICEFFTYCSSWEERLGFDSITVHFKAPHRQSRWFAQFFTCTRRLACLCVCVCGMKGPCLLLIRMQLRYQSIQAF